MRHLSASLLLLSLFLFGGCATKVDLFEYRDVSSVNVVDVSAQQYRVVIPKLDPQLAVKVTPKGGYSDYIANAFLSQNRVFNFAEKSTDTYRIALQLYNLDVEKRYYKRKFVETKEGGYYTKPYWKYTVISEMGLTLYNPDGSVRSVFNRNGSYTYRVDGHRQAAVVRSSYLKAIDSAVGSLNWDVANEMAPEGFVIAKKVHVEDEEDQIFMINMGRVNGLYREQRLAIYKNVIETDGVKGRPMDAKVFVGYARISNQIAADHAWVVMDDEDNNARVSVGDVVRAKLRH